MCDPSGPAGRDTVSSGLGRLLARLHSDPARAGAEYERLRHTLERFFDFRGAWPPDECADETLDRLAFKLTTDISIADVRAYARGIARVVLREWRRRFLPISLAARGVELPSAPPAELADDDTPAFSACFDKCLEALPSESRTLVLEYYVEERQARIDNRRRLARAWGVSESALRNRVQRVRDRVAQCMQRCAGAETVGSPDRCAAARRR